MSDKNTSKYRQLYDTLVGQILRREIAFGEFLPTELQLAERFGISRTTAQHALRLLAEEGFIRRSTKTGSRVVYLPPEARPPRTVYYIADSSTHHRAGFAQGLADELKKQDIRLVEKFFFNDESLQRRFVDECLHEKALGFVLFPTTTFANSDLLVRLNEEKYPFLIYDTYPIHPPYSTLAPDRYANVVTSVRYLAQSGHRHIGYFSMLSKHSGTMNDGRKGFLAAAESCGLPQSKENIFEIHTDTARNFQRRTCMLFARHILTHRNNITAIICGNDHLAFYLIEHARSLGIGIPRDISIVGHDDFYGPDSPFIALTTVQHPFYEAGIACAKLLLDKIGGNNEIKLKATIPGRLVVRDSSRRIFKKSAE